MALFDLSGTSRNERQGRSFPQSLVKVPENQVVMLNRVTDSGYQLRAICHNKQQYYFVIEIYHFQS